MKQKILKEETHPLTWRLHQDGRTIECKEYISKNGYQAIKHVLQNMSPKDVVNLITTSELKGRGGAGFYTGIKWGLILNNKNNNDVCYLLCNADEMEPGTYKDRFIMEKMPHLLIEGIIISAFALGASSAYIFLRGEYVQSERVLKKAILESINFGFLGKNILKSNFNLNIHVHTGAGRYICGEETALINSLEGFRANPRFKPPFPGTSGLWGKPTCINNVETLSNIPGIILNGSKWYKKLSLSNDRGTKLMGFCGQVNNPGLWEVPFGISARELLEEYAHGMKKGFSLKAWQPGGASTDFLTLKDIDISMDFEHVRAAGSRLGTGLAMAVDDKTNMVSVVLNIEKFFSRESCGWCTPCREGLPWIVNILKDIEKGNGRMGDIKILEDLCSNLSVGKTFCAHAPGAIEPLQSAIKIFRKDFEDGINFKLQCNLKSIPGIQLNLVKY